MMYQAATRDFDSLGEGADHGEPMACSIRDRSSMSPPLFLVSPELRVPRFHPSIHPSTSPFVRRSMPQSAHPSLSSSAPAFLGPLAVPAHISLVIIMPMPQLWQFRDHDHSESHRRVVVHIKVADLLLMACGSGENAPWHSPDIPPFPSPVLPPPPLLPTPADTRGSQCTECA
jgi:hypothetical protein